MSPREFPEQTVVFAKNQPEYLPLPAHVDLSTSSMVVTCCWQLTWRERIALLLTGKLWHQVLTFGKPLQPQMLHAKKPDMPQ